MPLAYLESLCLSDEDLRFHEFPKVTNGTANAQDAEQPIRLPSGRIRIAPGSIISTSAAEAEESKNSATSLPYLVSKVQATTAAATAAKDTVPETKEHDQAAKRQRIEPPAVPPSEPDTIKVPVPISMYDTSRDPEEKAKAKEKAKLNETKSQEQQPTPSPAPANPSTPADQSPAASAAAGSEASKPSMEASEKEVGKESSSIEDAAAPPIEDFLPMSTVQLAKRWRNDAREKGMQLLYEHVGEMTQTIAVVQAKQVSPAQTQTPLMCWALIVKCV